MYDFISDQQFKRLTPIDPKIWLSFSTMHEKELNNIKEAYYSN